MDIGPPTDPESEPPAVAETAAPSGGVTVTETTSSLSSSVEEQSDLPPHLRFADHPSWAASITPALRTHFSDETVLALHELLLEGKDVRPHQDAGWGSRPTKRTPEATEEEMAMNVESSTSQGRDRGRGRSGNARTGGRKDGPWQPEDKREVVSQVSFVFVFSLTLRSSRTRRVERLHTTQFESSSREVLRLQLGMKELVARRSPFVGLTSALEQDSSSASVSGAYETWLMPPARSNKPPYIHFTLQKTNRETMDCLGHIARVLKVHHKDLSVCGTKDKRAVTVQRVSFKRGNWTLEHVWKAVNGVKVGRRSAEESVQQRGDRGTRIGDLCYARKHLDLGMLKGNHFTITLRYVLFRKVRVNEQKRPGQQQRGGGRCNGLHP